MGEGTYSINLTAVSSTYIKKIKSGLVVYVCLSIGYWETRRPWGFLASQPSLLGESQASEGPCLFLS